MSHNFHTMIAARLNPELEEQIGKIADSLTLSASDLVRIGLSRVVEEFNQTGRVSVTPTPAPESDPRKEEA